MVAKKPKGWRAFDKLMKRLVTSDKKPTKKKAKSKK